MNHARNIWDRAITILPRANQFWYKYTYMEEMLKNVAGEIDQSLHSLRLCVVVICFRKDNGNIRLMILVTHNLKSHVGPTIQFIVGPLIFEIVWLHNLKAKKCIPANSGTNTADKFPKIQQYLVSTHTDGEWIKW